MFLSRGLCLIACMCESQIQDDYCCSFPQRKLSREICLFASRSSFHRPFSFMAAYQVSNEIFWRSSEWPYVGRMCSIHNWISNYGDGTSFGQ